MTQTLAYDAFTRALIAITDAAKGTLPHGIVPWTAFPADQEPPDTITRETWHAYCWNPPQFAAETFPDLYGATDSGAMDKPAWNTIVAQASLQACKQARQDKQAELAAELAAQTTFQHAGRIWQGDAQSTADIAAAATRAASSKDWPDDYTWYDAANAPVPMSAADMSGLAAALSKWRTARRIHARTLKDAIKAAGTPEEISAIDVATGWPGGRQRVEPHEAQQEMQ